MFLYKTSLAKQQTCYTGSCAGWTDARSDHAVLDLFCYFFVSRQKSKRVDKHIVNRFQTLMERLVR